MSDIKTQENGGGSGLTGSQKPEGQKGRNQKVRMDMNNYK